MVIDIPNFWSWLRVISTLQLPKYRNDAVVQPQPALIEAFKAGDENAFKTVFDQNFKKLYVFSFKLLKSHEQAEEVVNDAFLNVWMNRERIDVEQPILPYLYTATKRLALNSLRSIASSQKAVEGLWNTIDEISNQTEEVVFSNDLQRIAESKIAVLPPQQQQIFKLSRYEGLSYEEIAQKLNLSKNTVRNHLSAALKSLRAQLNESDF